MDGYYQSEMASHLDARDSLNVRYGLVPFFVQGCYSNASQNVTTSVPNFHDRPTIAT